MSRLFVFAMMLPASCGGPLKPSGMVPQSVPSVNRSMPELPEDVDVRMIAHEFYADAQALGIPLQRDVKSITFVDTYGKCSRTVGQCEYFQYEDGTIAYKTLTLKRDYWEASTPQTKKTLLFHELGHCATNLDHTSGRTAIMNPTVLLDEEAAPNWLTLVREMFATPGTLGLNEGEEEQEETCAE